MSREKTEFAEFFQASWEPCLRAVVAAAGLRQALAAASGSLCRGTMGWTPSHGQCQRVEDAMAVYVYKLRGQSRLLLGRVAPPPPLFGLMADAEDELHAFAARLAIRRDSGTPAGPQHNTVTRHYTLTEGERDHAVILGAQAITAREANKMERQRAVMRGESLP